MATEETDSKDTRVIRPGYYAEPTMDFFSLRNKAIAEIQKLSSNIWTDYNEHDPGVTILEQLCYAITDLSYRTSFPVEDILAEQPEYSSGRNGTFYTIKRIMPCRPETLEDWRKIFLDRVDGIENIWIEVIPAGEESPGTLYQILVQINERTKLKTEEDKEKIIREVEELFYRFRNLGEDIGSIRALKTRFIQIDASIGIDGKVTPEDLLADIYFSLYKTLCPPIPRYSYEEMRQKGYSPVEIFTGPLLKKGFILDSDLFSRKKQINISDLINAIRSVKGVDVLYSFSVLDPPNKDGSTFSVEDDEIAMLNIYSEIRQIKLMLNDAPLYADAPAVAQRYNQLLYDNHELFVEKKNREEINKLDVPKGENRHVDYYRSVQFTFPPLYGIGINRLADYGKEKTGLVLQLQGYLLLFDQMLTNYLEQLASVSRLFTIDEKINKTYFTKVPDKLPGLENLVDYPDENYDLILNKIMGKVDDFYFRRNLFLDHLLARFGVNVSEIAPDILNWYEAPEKEYAKFVINLKCHSLRKIVKFTRSRTAACNIFSPATISCYEEIVTIQLGMTGALGDHNKSYWSLAEPVINSHISLNDDHSKRVGITTVKQTDGFFTGQGNVIFNHYVSERLSENNRFGPGQVVQMLKEGLLYINLKMLVAGFVVENYTITEDPDYRFSIIYFNYSDGNPDIEKTGIRVGTFDNREYAEDLIPAIVLFIRNLNMRTEGMHLVENLLLRDSESETQYYLEFMDMEMKPFLISMDTANEAGRNQLAVKIIEAGRHNLSFNVHYDERQQNWTLHLLDGKNHAIARSYYKYKNPEELNQAIIKLETYFKFRIPVEEFIRKYVRFDAIDDIPASFYSYRFTVALPEWPSRFQDHFFRSRIEQILRDFAPAQLAIGIIYLSPLLMMEFEKKYMDWRVALSIDKNSGETKRAAHRLAIFLYKFNQSGIVI